MYNQTFKRKHKHIHKQFRKSLISTAILLSIGSTCVIPSFAEEETTLEIQSEAEPTIIETVIETEPVFYAEEITTQEDIIIDIPEPETEVIEQTAPYEEPVQLELETTTSEELITTVEPTTQAATQIETITEKQTTVLIQDEIGTETHSETQTTTATEYQSFIKETSTIFNQEENAASINTTTYNNVILHTYDISISDTVDKILIYNGRILSDPQKQILNACAATPAAAAGYCATWVANVYAKAGYSVGGNANDMRVLYGTSSNREDLRPGMIVAVERSNRNPESLGYIYGHVGIYIGDGLIVDSTSSNGSGIKTISSIDNWLAFYDVLGTAMWGFPNYVEADIAGQQSMHKQDPKITLNENGDVTLQWKQVDNIFGYLIYQNQTLIANIRNPKQTLYTFESEEDIANYRYSVQPYVRWSAENKTPTVVNDASERPSLELQSLSLESQNVNESINQIMAETVTPQNISSMINLVPNITKEELVALGVETYGVTARWMYALIGTTEREGYVNDPYLYYAWACAILNSCSRYSADDLYHIMEKWGSVVCNDCGAYYSEHAAVYGCGVHSSYSTLSELAKKCVYLALINRDYRITEVDGMISTNSQPYGYQLYYNSSVYNCQVWGR